MLGVEITTAENRDAFMCSNQAWNGIATLIPVIIFFLTDRSEWFMIIGLISGILVSLTLWF